MAITQERLKEVLYYDPETGVFTWRVCCRGTRAGFRASWLKGAEVDDKGESTKRECASSCFSFISCKGLGKLKLGKKCGAYCDNDSARR